MTITQTVEIPTNRRIILEVPREVPIGKAQVEVKVIPFVRKESNSASIISPKLRLTKKELDEILQNSDTPHTDALTGILTHLGDVSAEQIREERLAKHL